MERQSPAAKPYDIVQDCLVPLAQAYHQIGRKSRKPSTDRLPGSVDLWAAHRKVDVERAEAWLKVMVSVQVAGEFVETVRGPYKALSKLEFAAADVLTRDPTGLWHEGVGIAGAIERVIARYRELAGLCDSHEEAAEEYPEFEFIYSAYGDICDSIVKAGKSLVCLAQAVRDKYPAADQSKANQSKRMPRSGRPGPKPKSATMAAVAAFEKWHQTNDTGNLTGDIRAFRVSEAGKPHQSIAASAIRAKLYPSGAADAPSKPTNGRSKAKKSVRRAQ